MTVVDPADLSPRDRYGLMINTVVPRPIAVVGTVSQTGQLNLAPFSCFNAVTSTPFTVMIGPAQRPDGTDKDTLANCRPPEDGGTGCFTINAATEDNADAVFATAADLPPEASEFDHAGLSSVPADLIAAPRLASAAWSLECETAEVIDRLPKRVAHLWDGPFTGSLVFGLVRRIHLRDDILDDNGRPDPDRLAAVGRMGGPEWVRTQDRFIPKAR